MSKDKNENISVAIIGGGISGLVCGARLNQLGINKTTVFDTGSRGPGGRCSSRVINIAGELHIFDHAVQYFTVSDQRFTNIISSLYRNNALSIWRGPIWRLNSKTKSFTVVESQKFIGNTSLGMVSIARELTERVPSVQSPVWISHVRWHSELRKWEVDKHGLFDYLIIAHNGKCADRLMSQAGVPQIHNLLKVRFTPSVNPKIPSMQLCSLWVLLIKLESKLGLEFEGLHVDDDDEISWLGNNTVKYQQNHSGECWSILSTPAFGTLHKVPQEHVPKDKEKQVTQLLTKKFFALVGKSSKVLYTKVQLWGAANPLNTHKGEGFVFDCAKQVGIVGDWLVSPCIQGASISGLRMAEAIRSHGDGKLKNSVGLNCDFIPIKNDMIGCFPINNCLIFKPPC